MKFWPEVPLKIPLLAAIVLAGGVAARPPQPGDIIARTGPETYVLIGENGEISPIPQAVFEANRVDQTVSADGSFRLAVNERGVNRIDLTGNSTETIILSNTKYEPFSTPPAIDSKGWYFAIGRSGNWIHVGEAGGTIREGGAVHHNGPIFRLADGIIESISMGPQSQSEKAVLTIKQGEKRKIVELIPVVSHAPPDWVEKKCAAHATNSLTHCMMEYIQGAEKRLRILLEDAYDASYIGR